LIERFSEDVDLAIDREFLGYPGDLSKNKVKELRKASCRYISKELFGKLRERIEELDVQNLELKVRDFKDSDQDPVIIELNYEPITDPDTYLAQRVLLEISGRSFMGPYEKKGIRSLVGHELPERPFADAAVEVPTVHPQRTLLEKAFLLHEEFEKTTEKIRVQRMSRHLYDLEKLSRTEHAEGALRNKELYQRIIEHRKKFNPIKRLPYNHEEPERIAFIPPEEVDKAWEDDYKGMRNSMIAGVSKAYPELIESLKILQDRFRSMDKGGV
jgi:hypothetical protein